jgi:hypothetical protein
VPVLTVAGRIVPQGAMKVLNSHLRFSMPKYREDHVYLTVTRSHDVSTFLVKIPVAVLESMVDSRLTTDISVLQAYWRHSAAFERVAVRTFEPGQQITVSIGDVA